MKGDYVQGVDQVNKQNDSGTKKHSSYHNLDVLEITTINY